MTWLLYMCDMTRLWHDSFMCVTWLIHTRIIHTMICNICGTWRIFPGVIRDSCVCMTRLVYTYNITRLYVWHDSFICVMWLIKTCMIRTMCATWRIHKCVMTHAHALPRSAVHCSALQLGAVRCSALQCVAVRCSALQCFAVNCSV